MQTAVAPALAPSIPAFPKARVIFGVPLIILFILCADSLWLAQRFAYGQWVAFAGTSAYFLYMYRNASPRLRRLMIIGVVIATGGEVLFSLVIGMYEYRLGAIPFYVPPGHTILYAGVYMFIREPWVLRHREKLEAVLFVLCALFSAVWYAFDNDLYGLLCFGAFAVGMYFSKESKLFFVTMYLLVAYLELIGTSLQCWLWHPILLNRWEFIPSGNPPSGISVFYMVYDIICLGFYMLSDLERRRRYDSFKAFRKRKR